MTDNEGLAAGLPFAMNPHPVTAALERVRKQGHLILAEYQAAPFLFIAVVLFYRIEMLMTLLANQRCRLAIPQLRIGRIDRDIAKLGILDEGRIRIAGNLGAGVCQRFIALFASRVSHSSALVDVCIGFSSPFTLQTGLKESVNQQSPV
ncbi:hypothetical protein OEG84_22725 [Hoeflea sp. G2-23]|uniref:Uncharacterized protein n=1 Tax=Hoeflea algicola TaxID=2983763 RepID=A0ABT3ZF59_9HYPH|nr:hypothetical protein [Hoeflea algicola]MCY0150440.1 hypothetical protein [Hoeflea algicola]